MRLADLPLDKLARLDRQMLMDADWNDLYQSRNSFYHVLGEIAEMYGCTVYRYHMERTLKLLMRIR